MKKLVVLCLMLLLVFGCSPKQSDSDDLITIGILNWVTHPALDAAVEGMMEQVKAEIGEDKVEFILKNANSDESSAQLIVKDFVESEVDLIYAVATPSLTAAFGGTRDSQTPIIFAAVTDAIAA